MFTDTCYNHYYREPCCSMKVIVPDTMCDSMFNFDNTFQQQQQQQQHVSAEGFDFHQNGCTEMDLLMQTLEENQDFFDSTTFLASPSSMRTQRCYDNNFIANHNHQHQHQHQEPSHLFGNDFYKSYTTSQSQVQHKFTSVDTPPSGPSAPVQFEEFSLATQLPILNGYTAAYNTAETTKTVTNFPEFESLEHYSAQYFFTTPPNTPPNMLPVTAASMAVPAVQNLPRKPTTPSPAFDRTPTIRKLLQQKKKRMTAVPCHVNSVCSTCQTRTTSLWRRNHLGEIECNACNLYFRKNNCKRPVTLRKDEIMKRKRKPRVESTRPTGTSMTSATLDIKHTITRQHPRLFT